MATLNSARRSGDMTQGAAMPLILAFVLPLIGSTIFQQLYNLADTLIIGQYLGVDSLAAVSSSGTIAQLLMLVGAGAGMGATIIVGQFYGAGDYKRVKICISTALITFLSFGLLLTAAGLLGGRAVLVLMRTPDNLIPEAYCYLWIYVLGMPFVVLYNVCTSIFNGMGDSRRPLLFLIFSSVLNVALDILFVGGFHWGVAGAAIATVIAQGLACLLALVSLLRRVHHLCPERAEHTFDRRTFTTICRIGVPSMLQMASVAIGAMLIQAIVNPYGSAIIAGYTVATKISNIATGIIHVFGQAVSTFTAQNLGIARYDRPAEGVRSVMKILVFYVVAVIVIFAVFGKALIGLFDSSGDAVMVATGYRFLLIQAPFYFLYSWSNAVNGVSRGAGYMLGFMICTMTDIVCRMIFAVVLNRFLGVDGVFLSFPLGWIVNAAIATIAYKGGKWKKSLVGSADES